MKHLLLISLFSFYLKNASGQNLIHSSKREVYSYLNKKGITNAAIETGKRDVDNANWVAYSDATAKNIYFFDSTSICNYYRRVYPIIYFDATLKFINKHYESIGESLWQDKNDKESFVLCIRVENNFFTLDEYQSIGH